MAPKYATVTEVKTNIGKTGAEDDVNLAVVLDAAEAAIDRICNRLDGFKALTTATARVFFGLGKPFQFIDECVAITTVAVKDSPTDSTYTAWAAADWVAFSGDPQYPDFNGLPYTGVMVDPGGDFSVFISGKFSSRKGFSQDLDVTFVPRQIPTVKVTARWGYSVAAPAQVKLAAIALTARWWKRGKGSWQNAVQSADFGTMNFDNEDKDIMMMLKGAGLVKPHIGWR